jgi:hypothetical protein
MVREEEIIYVDFQKWRVMTPDELAAIQKDRWTIFRSRWTLNLALHWAERRIQEYFWRILDGYERKLWHQGHDEKSDGIPN